MERIEALDMMGELKLYGMKAAYDATLSVALNLRRRLTLHARFSMAERITRGCLALKRLERNKNGVAWVRAELWAAPMQSSSRGSGPFGRCYSLSFPCFFELIPCYLA
jgi:hypothetical protein